MTDLTADLGRTYAMNADIRYNEVNVAATTDLFEGMAIEDNASGFAVALTGSNPFLGFAMKRADNNPGSAGDIRVHLAQAGLIKLTLGATLTQADLGEVVYAHDSNDFDRSSTGGEVIGKIESLVDISATGAGIAWVRFEGRMARSLDEAGAG